MLVTIVAAVIVMVAYFLLLYGMVAFVQDKRFMSTAPKENLAVIPDRKERFRGAHAGWMVYRSSCTSAVYRSYRA